MNIKIPKILWMVALALCVACGKEEAKDDDAVIPDEPPKGVFSNCRITEIAREGFNTVFFDYDAEGKQTGWRSDDATTKISASTGVIIINHIRDGELSRKETVSLNAAGLATRVEIEYFGNYPRKEYIEFEYDDKNQVFKRKQTNDKTIEANYLSYQWHEGNLVAVLDDIGVLVSYTYTTEPVQPADWFNQLALVEGYSTVRNKNMVRTVKEKKREYTHSYAKNENGLIETEFVDSPNIDYKHTFTYECDK